MFPPNILKCDKWIAPKNNLSKILNSKNINSDKDKIVKLLFITKI